MSTNDQFDEKSQKRRDIYDIHEASFREQSLPDEGNEKGPWWLYTIIALTFAFGFFYMGFYFGEFSQQPHTLYTVKESDVEEVQEISKSELGEQLYGQVCQTCHQANGQGVPGVFPTLHDAPLAVNEKEKLVALILHGLEGKLVRDNGTYDAMMPPWESRLNDEELAAVATYVRQSFDNKASEVMAEDVTPIRDLNRDSYWTEEELSQKFSASE